MGGKLIRGARILACDAAEMERASADIRSPAKFQRGTLEDPPHESSMLRRDVRTRCGS